MSEYQFTPQAADDLFEIWSYIARDSIEAANRVEAAICEACNFLAATPLAGHVRKDLSGVPVRFWPVPSKSFGFFMARVMFQLC
jgi:plasmid stabilization system protein ParE